MGKWKRSNTDLLSEWRNKNCRGNALFVTSMGIFASSLMVFFDPLFLSQYLEFAQIRLICILLMLPNFWLIKKAAPAKRARLYFSGRTKISFITLWPILIFNLSYFYFTYFNFNEKFFVYYTGLLLTTFFCTFMLHRFPKEQFVYNGGFSLLALSLLWILPKSQYDSLYILVILHLSASFLAIYLRRQFHQSLHTQFRLFKTMVPEKVAFHIVVGSERLSNHSIFKPRARFSVCMCADWRNFQKLSGIKSPEEISAMLEKYYDIILKNLETLLPHKNYYFNWNADELFIVFFNDYDDEKSAMSEGLKFAFQICSQIYDHIREEFHGEVTYDVGLSAGIGLIGMVGPKEMKKTTIHGKVAGRAKRFEQEAKSLRHLRDAISPTLVMEASLYKLAKELALGGEGQFEIHKARMQDIENEDVYVWTSPEMTTMRKAA
jgi:hypothetical protein